MIGYADITKMRARKFTGIGKYEDFEIPDYCMENLNKFKGILDEAVASVDEDNMEKYFRVKNLHSRKRTAPCVPTVRTEALFR